MPSPSPAPESQVERLGRLLRVAPMLQGWCEVIVGRKQLTLRKSPPSAVLMPQRGVIENPRKKDTAHRDVSRQMAVRLWGGSINELLELQTRFVQALAYQAVGGLPNNPNVTPGFFWQLLAEEWEQLADTMTEGEELEMTLVVVNSLDKIVPTLGQVQSSAFTLLTTTLSAQLLATDATATVASTAGLPWSGVLTIDAEQIRYTSTTPTTFVGLVRGINATTPATHAQGATVNVL